MASFLSKVRDKARNRKLNFSSRRATDKEVAKTAAKLRKLFKESVEKEEKSKLDEIMDELNDKDKNTIH